MEPSSADYRTAIDAVLPDLPDRSSLVEVCARWLERVAIANRHVNLTRIVEPHEAAVKHVLDSLTPWRELEDASAILDLGSGAGFPGLPLALLDRARKVRLVDSVGKKARFLEATARELEIANVRVEATRAETTLRRQATDVVVVRAVASTEKLLRLLAPVRHKMSRLVLYKGASGSDEFHVARSLAGQLGWRGRVVAEYELPEGAGRRSLLEYRAG